MASSSTSSIPKSFKYDVFLSFRGEDTRKNFIDHLYHALQQKSIHTYKDDERIKKGKNISDELIGSIEASRFYIIVFSKNYASSSWCLDELVKIMECHRTKEHTAYPVFYDVEPTEIRKQSGAVKDAFSKQENEESAVKWRNALIEATGLAGWELKHTADGHEAKVIQKIVEVLSLGLRCMSYNIDENLVGMETRIKNILSSLGTDVDDLCMIGFKGMGGAGKTTLARAIYDRIAFRFEGKSFVENIREASNASSSGLMTLQNQVLSDVLNDKDNSISSVHDGKHMIKKKLSDKKVIIVLDNVDHKDQLEAFAGAPNWFKAGSLIIITTRNEQVLISHQVKLIRDVNLLTNNEAICLFNRYAFGREIQIQGYKELSTQVVRYAAGLPLTIKVLGSFLCGKSELEWKDAIKRLATIPLEETMKKLELSFIGLEKDYKEIFLDITCILKGWQKEKAIKALESCDLHARIGLRVLEQKSLVTISFNGSVEMHDHIEEMGKDIVRRLHPEKPHKHSRLWIKDEVEEILANDLNTKATRCLQYYSVESDQHILLKGLKKMKELRFLSMHFRYASSSLECSILSPEFSNAVRYLKLQAYPFRSLPNTFQANCLVALTMADSKIKQLWEGDERKVLNKLRFLDLKRSSKLMTIDLQSTPNLETLNLSGCCDLIELHMASRCLNLKSLKLSGSKLRTLDIGLIPNIEYLNLRSNVFLEELHMASTCQNLTKLIITHSNLRTLDIGLTLNLEYLNLVSNDSFEEFHMAGACQKLTELCIADSKLRTLDLGMIPNINRLDLRGCSSEELHLNGECQKISYLHISNSKLRTLDIGSTLNLVILELKNCYNLEELCMAGACQKLTKLIITHSKLRTLDIRLTPDLEILDLQNCCCLEELYMAGACQKLTKLILTHSKLRTLDIGLIPNLENLDLDNCRSFEVLQMTSACQKLTTLVITHSELRTLDIGLIPNLEYLNLGSNYVLEELRMAGACQKLTKLHISGSKLRTLDLGMISNLNTLDLGQCCSLEELHIDGECQKLAYLNASHSKLRALDLGLTPNLETLNLNECCNLVELHIPNGCLQNVVYFSLSGCLGFKSILFNKIECYSTSDGTCEHGSFAEWHVSAESLGGCPYHPNNFLPKFQFSCVYPHDRHQLTGIPEMHFSVDMCACKNLEMFSRSICVLRHARDLDLKGSMLEVSENIGQLERLKSFTLSFVKIKHLPDSICTLKHLKSLKLESCLLLEKLPEDIGRLECLEELTLLSTTIEHLPDSICMLKRLQSLKIIFCWLLEMLPKDLGRLECLEKLTLSSAKIRHLPDSICMLKYLKVLKLDHCSLLEKLPEELGCLKHLRKLHIGGTSINHLPQSIFSLKGLLITGSRGLLESFGYIFEIKTFGTFCSIQVAETEAPREGSSSNVLHG